MNGAHQHLIVNHVSIFSLIIGTIVLVISMKRKSVDLRVLASVLFVMTGIFAGIADLTGDRAAHVLMEHGGDFKPFIHEHALAAEWAERSGILVAILAIAMEWVAHRKQNWLKPLQWILLIFALHGCTVFVRTVYLGGLIRHSEIRSDQPLRQIDNSQ